MQARWASVGSALLLLLAFIGYTWATWQFFTSLAPGGNDFLTHYGGWEAYLRLGLNPYSDEAALHTQIAIYGRAALPGEDQNRMAYPFFSILLHGPFVLIADYPLARALYMTLEQAAVFFGAVLCLRVFRWQAPLGMQAFVLGWSLLNYHTARGILIGQFALLAFCAIAVMLILLHYKRDALAGAVLVVTMIKPPLVFLLVPYLIGWAFVRRRWRFIAGFFSVLTILSVGSFAILPTWLSDWLYRVIRYPEYTVNQSPLWTLSAWATAGLGAAGPILWVALLMFGLGWAWWCALRDVNNVEFYWAFGITLVISNLLSPRTATTDYVLMLVPTLWMLVVLDRVPGWGRIAMISVMAIALVGPWVLHLATVQGNSEQAAMFLPWPLTLGAILVFARRGLITDARQMGIQP